jgi:hypothetical protein
MNGKTFDRLKSIHYVRATKGPGELTLVFCTACGFLAAHETYDDAVTDLRWHREEIKNV